tara:strand:- start:796 stop:1827 length:1032 start_codon:yes stop_codon:yes gene_type:complete
MFTCQLSNHLINLGHEVKIVALYAGLATLPFNGKIEVLNNTHSNRFLDFKHWKKLANIISNFQPDLVQANAGDTLKYAVFSKKLFSWKEPIIFRNASEVGRYLKSPVQKSLNRFLYKNVEWVISVSKASKNDIVKHFPFLKDKVEVVGVGLEEMKNPESRILDPRGHKHIVHVGGFSFEKNHKVLIQIFQLILKKQPHTHLHLVGDGPLKPVIEELVRSNSLQDHVSFYGFVSDPLTYISAADVLVLPSIIEGLPGVILEAMICKVPVVAYNVGGISEILSDETGFLIPQNDCDAFANKTLEALDLDSNKMIEQAYNLVSSNFMNSNLALNFVNSYQKLVPIL